MSNENHIPNTIAENEVIVRNIFHPLFIKSRSKGGLKEQAFLPPHTSEDVFNKTGKIRNDVSVLRLEYTNADFCKNHALQIPIKEYCGLAILKVKDCQEINSKLNDIQPYKCEVISTPLVNLPMHADIIYSNLTIVTYRLQDKTFPFQVRAIAKSLAQAAKYYPDPNPLVSDWKGVPLV